MRARCVKVTPKCKQLPIKQVHMDMSQRNLHGDQSIKSRGGTGFQMWSTDQASFQYTSTCGQVGEFRHDICLSYMEDLAECSCQFAQYSLFHI